MKRKILGMLIAAICLSLCACGNSGSNNQSNDNEQNNNVQTEGNVQTESEKEDISFLVGTWCLAGKDDDVERFTIKEDGTATLKFRSAEFSGEWSLEENHVRVVDYGFEIQKTESGHIHLVSGIEDELWVREEEYNSYQRVELTAENWDNYFEIVNDYEYIYNEFKELENVRRNRYILIKESVGVPVLYNAPTLECKYDWVLKKVRYDSDAKEYVFEKLSNEKREEITNTIEIKRFTLTDGTIRYGILYSDGFSGNIEETFEGRVYENFELLRTTGPLILRPAN